MKKTSTVLVCVTGQRDCDRLIRAGRQIADQNGIEMHVLCVQPTSSGYDTSCEELEYLRQTAKNAGAEMTIYFNDETAAIAAGFIRQIGAVHLVTGMAASPANGFIDIVHKLVPHIPISMVAKDETIYHIYPNSVKTALAAQT